MSQQALNLLVDSGLLTPAGKLVRIEKLPNKELSDRISNYINKRILTAKNEIDSFVPSNKLSALFGSESTEPSALKILPSALIYESLVIDDPLVTKEQSISYNSLINGLTLFSTYFKLIKADFIKVVPLSFYNDPSNEIPILMSDDSFKSSIPSNLHDFIHSRAHLKSVIKNNKGEMLVLNEEASQSRRPALNVGFTKDFWKKGVSLYLFKTIENAVKSGNSISYEQVWRPEQSLEEDQFNRWSYQTINQAMRIRLRNIYNETKLANDIGHTYVTESEFESELLSLSGTENHSSSNIPCRFIHANNLLINIEKPETIIELREKYSVAHERFNLSILHAMDHLKSVDPQNFELYSKMYFTKEISPQIDELRNNIKAISRSATKGALVSLGGLTSAMLAGSLLPLIPSLMLTAVGSATEALDSVGRHQDFKKTPAYIWHRIAKK